MPIDLRHAALGPEQQQRLRFAANGLAARRSRVALSPWDGTRCTVLVANADDGYGQVAMRLARQRGTPVVALAQAAAPDGGDVAWLRPAASVQHLVAALESLLGPAPGGDGTRPLDAPSAQALRGEEATEGDGVGLIELARAHVGRDLLASVAGRSYLVLRAAGRMRARSLSDALALEAKLGDAAWQFEPVSERHEPEAHEIGTSLDAALVNAAFNARESLPRFAQGRYRLLEWPDLGRAPRHVVALFAAQRLQRGWTSADELALACGGDRLGANASLWAFASAGLLERAGEAAAATANDTAPFTPRRIKGMLQRLARHFGMVGHG